MGTADQCLNSPEILRLVFDQLVWRKHILSAGLTCRLFLEPALDMLWREIETTTFLGCLPSDLLEYREVPYEQYGNLRKVYVAYLRRELRPGDLNRYLTFYAYRIRSMRMQARIFIRKMPSAELLQALQVITDFRPGALCPQVINIAWGRSAYTKEDIQHQLALTLFLGPGTLRLSLSVDPGRYVEVTFLKYILKHVPFLKELQIQQEARNIGVGIDPVVYLTDNSLDRLESLAICQLSDGAIPYLASLPCLNSLRVCLDHHDPFITPPNVGRKNAFASLRSLDLFASWSNIVSLLQHLPCDSPIETLRVDHTSNDVDSLLHRVRRVQKIIDTVASHANPATLRSLHAAETFPDLAEQEEDLDLGQAIISIEPLFAFQQLRWLSLRCSCDATLPTPKEARMIPVVWPNIENLSFLSGSSCVRRIPRIDHTDLLELTYNCRHLKTLELTFDATKITGKEQHLARPDLAPPQFDTLSIHLSPIESPSQVAAFLAHHCPALKYLALEEGSPKPYCERWFMVREDMGI